MLKTRDQSLGRKDLLEKEMATYYSILAWRIPWIREPGRHPKSWTQLSTKSWKRGPHDGIIAVIRRDTRKLLSSRRKWKPTPVFLSGKSNGQRNLEGCSLWGCQRVRHNLVTKQQQQTLITYQPAFFLNQITCFLFLFNVSHRMWMSSIIALICKNSHML